MKVIIAGGRDFDRGDTVLEAVKDFKASYGEITEVVCGMCRGADMMGLNYANLWGIPVKRFPPFWNTYGKKAGILRNEEMGRYADGLIAFWDGKSKGTKHMIDFATRCGLKILVVRY